MAIDDLALPVAVFYQGVPQAPVIAFFMEIRTQEAGRLADGILRRVAGDFGERRVHGFDQTIGACDHDGLPDVLEDLGGNPHAGLGAATLGQVEQRRDIAEEDSFAVEERMADVVHPAPVARGVGQAVFGGERAAPLPALLPFAEKDLAIVEMDGVDPLSRLFVAHAGQAAPGAVEPVEVAVAVRAEDRCRKVVEQGQIVVAGAGRVFPVLVEQADQATEGMQCRRDRWHVGDVGLGRFGDEVVAVLVQQVDQQAVGNFGQYHGRVLARIGSQLATEFFQELHGGRMVGSVFGDGTLVQAELAQGRFFIGAMGLQGFFEYFKQPEMIRAVVFDVGCERIQVIDEFLVLGVDLGMPGVEAGVPTDEWGSWHVHTLEA